MAMVALANPGRDGDGDLVLGFVDRPDADLLSDKTEPGKSFAVFYRRHVDALIRFGASRGLAAEATADVVADTFLAALEGRYRYRPERESARLWLLAIASRRMADVHRRRLFEDRREQRLRGEVIVLTQADHDSYDRLLEAGDGRALDALADLPELQQRVLRARLLEERDYKDIAIALGLTEPAARKHVSRGLAALRRMLKG